MLKGVAGSHHPDVVSAIRLRLKCAEKKRRAKIRMQS